MSGGWAEARADLGCIEAALATRAPGSPLTLRLPTSPRRVLRACVFSGQWNSSRVADAEAGYAYRYTYNGRGIGEAWVSMYNFVVSEAPRPDSIACRLALAAWGIREAGQAGEGRLACAATHTRAPVPGRRSRGLPQVIDLSAGPTHFGPLVSLGGNTAPSSVPRLAVRRLRFAKGGREWSACRAGVRRQRGARATAGRCCCRADSTSCVSLGDACWGVPRALRRPAAHDGGAGAGRGGGAPVLAAQRNGARERVHPASVSKANRRSPLCCVCSGASAAAPEPAARGRPARRRP